MPVRLRGAFLWLLELFSLMNNKIRFPLVNISTSKDYSSTTFYLRNVEKDNQFLSTYYVLVPCQSFGIQYFIQTYNNPVSQILLQMRKQRHKEEESKRGICKNVLRT
jgi:hypothetical protein